MSSPFSIMFIRHSTHELQTHRVFPPSPTAVFLPIYWMSSPHWLEMQLQSTIILVRKMWKFRESRGSKRPNNRGFELMKNIHDICNNVYVGMCISIFIQIWRYILIHIIYIELLVGGIPTPLKNISRLGLLFPIYGKS